MSILKNLLIVFCATTIFLCCEDADNYQNQKSYTIKKGEKFNIYYKTNSCCAYCINNLNFKKVKILKKETLYNENKHCEGCEDTQVYTLIGNELGKDTVIIRSIDPNSSCDTLNQNTIWEEEIIYIQVE